uniref:Uncharacterized protein n=1 Tax=Timema douglasi TaxID=61478 RepID=A0A7R8VEZ8_TIMDO|nr:unnamed protein product [Timema douglasi]
MRRTKNARRVVNDTLLTLYRVDERERKSREQWWLIRRATAFVLDTPTMPKGQFAGRLLCVFVLFVPSSSFTWPNRWYNALMPEWDNGPTRGWKGLSPQRGSLGRWLPSRIKRMKRNNQGACTAEESNEVAWERFPSKLHPTEIRTSISPSSAVELNTTSVLANCATEVGIIAKHC